MLRYSTTSLIYRKDTIMQPPSLEIWTLARYERFGHTELEKKTKDVPLVNLYEFEAEDTHCPIKKDNIASLFDKCIKENPSTYYEVAIQMKEKTVSVYDGTAATLKCFHEGKAFNSHGLLFFTHHPEKDHHKNGVPNRIFIFTRSSILKKGASDTETEELLKKLSLEQERKPELYKIKEAEAKIQATDPSIDGFPARVFLFVSNTSTIELRSKRDSLIREADQIKEEFAGKDMPEHFSFAIAKLERTLATEKGLECSIL